MSDYTIFGTKPISSFLYVEPFPEKEAQELIILPFGSSFHKA